MKFKEHSSSAVKVGDIQSNAVSIDAANLDFIITILSSGLYSNPINSFIREIVSNAWDSHVEANNTTQPVVLELGQTTEGQYFCKIQDFGVGLSPERFNKVYRNIGSSTKRDTNKMIGGFGIGRFSALSYSNVVKITSYYKGHHITLKGDLPESSNGYVITYKLNGEDFSKSFKSLNTNVQTFFLEENEFSPENIQVHFYTEPIDQDSEGELLLATNVDVEHEFASTEYLYLMCKENNTLTIDLLYTKPTTSANGVSVEIDVKNYDVQKFVNAIESQLAYFNNLVIIESIPNKPYGIEERFNNFKIKNYKNFCVNTLNSVHPTILLGKVNYPIRFSDLKKSYSSDVMNKYPIALKFDIGDIGVTPNREELLYTTESIAAIEKALDASIQEIDDLFAAQNTKDYQDIDEFFDQLEDKNTLVLAEDGNTRISIFSTGMDKKTFKGKEYSCKEVLKIDRVIKNYSTGESYYLLNQNRSLTYKQTNYLYLQSFLNQRTVCLCDVAKLNTHAKAYLRETYPEDSVFIKEINKKGWIKFLIKYLKSKLSSWDRDSFKLVLQQLGNKYDSLPKFSNANVPKKFIEDRKAAAKANRSSVKREENYWKQNVNLESKDEYGHTETDNYKLKDLNTRFKKLTVYSFKGDPRLESFHQSFPNVKFVGVAPTKMKLLKDLSNFVNIEKFMDKKYKAIRNLATSVYLQKQLPDLGKLAGNPLLESVSARLYKIVKELYTFCRDNQRNYADAGLSEEIYDYCLENNAFNEEILGVYKANEKELNNLDVFVLISNLNIGGYSSDLEKTKLVNLITDYALAKRLFRPDLEAVKKLKKETILNIK